MPTQDEWMSSLDRLASEFHGELRDNLVLEIEEFCKKHGISQSLFGSDALGDRSFYRRLKTGRQGLKLVTQARVDAYLQIGPSPDAIKIARTDPEVYGRKIEGHARRLARQA